MNASLRAFAVLVFVLAASRSFAQCPLDPSTTTADDRTCYVSTTNGNDQNPGTSASPMKTIQAALDRVAAAGGNIEVTQTVRVLPGTYEECPFLGSEGIRGDVNIVADAFLTGGDNSTTIVDGTKICVPKQFPVFELGENSSLRGFTIKGGGNSGVAAYGHSTISNNVIIDSISPSIGGGVYLRTGPNVSDSAEEARIENNSIRNNTSVLSGGGIYVFADGDGLPSRVVINSNTVSQNTAGEGNTEDSIFGGGITVFTDAIGELDSSTVVITNNTIEGNEAIGLDIYSASYGGGLFVATYGGLKQTIEVGSTVVDSIRVKSPNVIRNNAATHGFGGGIAALGQALYPGDVDHSVRVEANAVSGNTAEFGGGGIYALTQPLAIGATDKVVVDVLSNDVAGNSVTGAADELGVTGGGGIYAEFFNEQSAGANNALNVVGNSLRNNTSASFGGGAALWVRTFGEPPTSKEGPLPASSRLRFVNNLVTGNRAEDTQSDLSLGEGGGVFIRTLAQGGGTSAVDSKFNTLANNTADTGLAGGVAVVSTNVIGPTSGLGSSSVDISNSILISNSGFAVGGTAVPGVENTTVRIAYNDTFQNGAGPFAPQYTPGPGNLTVNPELDEFFVPVLCSPTIDAGDPAEDIQEERQPNGGVANLGHTGLTQNATVTLPDASGDSLVDGVDILRIATSFASVSTDVARYNEDADVDKDGDVDGDDLTYISAWFGKACQ